MPLFLLLLAVLCLPIHAADLTGNWLGTITAGAAELRLGFRIETKDGGLTGTLDSIDQGARGIRLGTITIEDGKVSIPIPTIMGRMEGKLSEDGNEIAGVWKQGPGEVPLTIRRVTDIPRIARPQEPKKPYPYDETEVTYENKEQNVKLAGTLTTPKNKKGSPAVLLITGSGPQDRDESLMEHKPFLILSDYLTRRGFAVLRVDDRGVGGSTGDMKDSTTFDFAKDVLAGVAFLKTRPEVDPRQIGLLGHSEGGLIAPIVASQSKDIAFIVLLAGPGVNGEKIVVEQSALIAKGMGVAAEGIAAQSQLQHKLFAILSKEPDNEKAKDMLKQAGAPPQAAAFASPWFRAFLLLEPTEYLKKVTCPVLAINGELDLQVPPKQNLPVIEKTLKEAGNKDFLVKEMPGLNHLFQGAKTGLPTEYGKIEETMSPSALETVATWIAQHTKTSK